MREQIIQVDLWYPINIELNIGTITQTLSARNNLEEMCQDLSTARRFDIIILLTYLGTQSLPQIDLKLFQTVATV